MDEKMTGKKGNNPGNIRVSNTPWKGKILPQNGEFEAFETMQFGVRAMAKILINYMKVKKLTTLIEILNTYAPPVENDTGSYIRHVAHNSGFLPDEHLQPDAKTLQAIIGPMIVHENGTQVATDQEIIDGVRSALNA